MKSQRHGVSTSSVEVGNIDRHGIWLLVGEAEYFLPYKDYPWFEDARVADILDVKLLHEGHLHWPALDVDISLSSLRNPEGYPLIYK